MTNDKNYSYWFWKKFFNRDEIISINNYIDLNFDGYEDRSNGATDAFGNYKKNTIVKLISLEKMFRFQSIKNLFNSIHYSNKNNFGYDLYPDLNFNNFLYNVYDSKTLGKYDYHSDVSKNNILSIKLTLIINLSTEQYSGGEFYLFDNEEKKMNEISEPGDAMIFSSYLSHKVTPVTSGVRKSLAYFFEGPRFK